MGQTYTKLVPREDISLSQVSVSTHFNFFNIFNAENLHREQYSGQQGFGILFLLANANNWSISDLCNLIVCDPLIRTITLYHSHRHRHVR